jgi:hypothetical protein
MAEQQLQTKFKSVVLAVAAALKPHGFAKRGTKFRRGEPNVQLIEFQRSISNDATSIKFTLNVGVVSARALRHFDPEAEPAKASVLEAHLRERIGTLSDERTDRWWQIDNQSNEQAINSEIVDLVIHKILPWLEKYSTDEALVDLWKSGRSPGLTEGQRNRYLTALG